MKPIAPEIVAKWLALRAQGHGCWSIARRYGVAPQTVRLHTTPGAREQHHESCKQWRTSSRGKEMRSKWWRRVGGYRRKLRDAGVAA